MCSLLAAAGFERGEVEIVTKVEVKKASGYVVFDIIKVLATMNCTVEILKINIFRYSRCIYYSLKH